MALDIAKFGRKPYDRLEKPGLKPGSNSHITRYLNALLSRLIVLAFSALAFLTPVWVFDFGLDNGSGRIFFLRIFSAVIFCFVLILFIFDRKIWNNIFKNKYNKSIFFLIISSFFIFGAGTFSKLGLFSGFGISFFSNNASLFEFFACAIWLLVILYIKPNIGFVKTIFVSWFIGCGILVFYNLFLFFLKNGYDSIIYLQYQGFQLIFAINIFLLLSFAMFQKRFVKAVWTINLFSHLLLLFIFDFFSIWIILLVAISLLLIFQIIYSKKLWQRNFTYPLQIFGIVFLFLLIPIKLFTGINVPNNNFFEKTIVTDAVFQKKISLFGEGLGSGSNYIGLNTISSTNIENKEQFFISKNIIQNGWISLYIETGALGIFIFILFIIVFVFQGIKFFNKNFESLKEGDMPESVYLGLVFFISFLMLALGLWFSPFSVFLLLLLFLILGSSSVFWQKNDLDSKDLEKTKNESSFLIPFSVSFTFVLIILFLSGFFIFLNFRIFNALSKSKEIASEKDVVLKFEKMNFLSNQIPWNLEYKIKTALYETDLLAQDIPVNEQKQSLENITSLVKEFSINSKDPIANWFSAVIYKKLNKYAEGGSSMARASYIKTMELWPKNLAIPVVVSKFYRDNINDIVLSGISSVSIHEEAKDNLRRVLSLQSDYLPARLEMSFLIEEDEGPESALLELSEWESSSPEILYHVGRLYFNKGEFDVASEKFLKVTEQINNHSNALYSLGICYYRLEKYKESLEKFEEVLKLNPNNDDIEKKIEQIKERIVE